MKHYLVEKAVVSGGEMGTKVTIIEEGNEEVLNFEFRADGGILMNGDVSFILALATKHPALMSLILQKSLTQPVLEAHFQQQGYRRFAA